MQSGLVSFLLLSSLSLPFLNPAPQEPASGEAATSLEVPLEPVTVPGDATGTLSALQDGGDPGDIPWPPVNIPDWLLDDLDPIYSFETDCPDLLVLVNETKCTLYFRTYLDCDGDGFADTMQEHFVGPADDRTGTPWVEFIEADRDCDILYWGLFDILPLGGCDPAWEQNPDFPCTVNFY